METLNNEVFTAKLVNVEIENIKQVNIYIPKKHPV